MDRKYSVRADCHQFVLCRRRKRRDGETESEAYEDVGYYTHVEHLLKDALSAMREDACRGTPEVATLIARFLDREPAFRKDLAALARGATDAIARLRVKAPVAARMKALQAARKTAREEKRAPVEEAPAVPEVTLDAVIDGMKAEALKTEEARRARAAARLAAIEGRGPKREEPAPDEQLEGCGD